MKKILFALLLLIAVEARASRDPVPPHTPPIIVDTFDLYPDFVPPFSFWWLRLCHLFNQP